MSLRRARPSAQPPSTPAVFVTAGVLALVVVAATSAAAVQGCDRAAPEPIARTVASATTTYDPLAAARASIGKTRNLEAGVPSMCYTRTAGVSNPCWTCHTTSALPNARDDWDLQLEYAFSDAALENHWGNLFVDRSSALPTLSDDALLRYVRADNYAPLRTALTGRDDYRGYVPDLDFARGFDERGFARDASGWRAVRYKPFLGTFWPTNGSTDDVFIRLPLPFRVDAAGQLSNPTYEANLALLEQAIADDATSLDASHFVGGAASIPVTTGLYPAGTEFLHSVRYLDPDSPTFMAQRMKELRYMKKASFFERDVVLLRYEDELAEKELGRMPEYPGDPFVGYRNAFGWQLQGFIEDAEGRLRAQTEEEHRFCMGCHTGIGVTIDQTFSFARKVPGLEGWRPQDARGIRDVPQRGHALPEYAEYLLRVGGGDELRANDEMLARFFPGGALAMNEVRRAAPGGDRDITHLIVPSRARALTLDRAYLVTVREQSYTRGRDATVRPAANVHTRVENGDTELGRTGMVFRDGTLRLDWTSARSSASGGGSASEPTSNAQPGTAYGLANRRSRTTPLP